MQMYDQGLGQATSDGCSTLGLATQEAEATARSEGMRGGSSYQSP